VTFTTVFEKLFCSRINKIFIRVEDKRVGKRRNVASHKKKSEKLPEKKATVKEKKEHTENQFESSEQSHHQTSTHNNT
jgi:hypothetical protein